MNAKPPLVTIAPPSLALPSENPETEYAQLNEPPARNRQAAVAHQNSKPNVLMMQTAQPRQRHDGANRSSAPKAWCVFVQ